MPKRKDSSSDTSTDDEEHRKKRRHGKSNKHRSSKQKYKEMDSRIDKLTHMVEQLTRRSQSGTVPRRHSRSLSHRRSRSRSPLRSPSDHSRSGSVISLGRDYRAEDLDLQSRDSQEHGSDQRGSVPAKVQPGSGESVQPNQINLDAATLDLLGESRKESVPEGPPIFNDIAVRWDSIAKKGLSADEKSKLAEKYPAPANCSTIAPPALNAEVEAALSNFTLQRDREIQAFQAQVSGGISAIGSALTSVLSAREAMEKAGINSGEFISPISDAARQLLDLQHSLSLHRRTVISPNIKSNLKSLIKSTNIDNYLFGSDLPQKIKTAQELSRAGKEIRNEPSKFVNKSKSKAGTGIGSSSKPLNYQRPPAYRRKNPNQSRWEHKGGRRQAENRTADKRQYRH